MRPTPLLSLALALALAPSLAGCLQNGGDGDGDDHEATWTDSNEFGIRINDLELHDTITPGSASTWRFEAENFGPTGNRVDYNAACDGPFEVTVRGPDGREVAHEEPRAGCTAEDLRTLDGGDRVPFAWTWDGRVWDGSALVPATAGVHTIRVDFTGYHDGNRAHEPDAWGETTVLVADG